MKLPAPAGLHRYALDSARFLRLRRCAGAEVVCADGELWITQEGSASDVVLKPGQRWRVPDGQPVLIGAFGAAQAHLWVPAQRGAWPSWRPPAALTALHVLTAKLRAGLQPPTARA